MATKNLITYQDLASTSKKYMEYSKAFEEANSTLKTITENLASAWENDTATAYADAYKTEYGPALKNISIALESISKTIDDYVSKVKELDTAGKNAF